MTEVNDLATLQESIKCTDAILLYFSNPKCSVCNVIKPKIVLSYQNLFPKLKQFYINIEANFGIANQFEVHTIPTVIIIFQGKETIRRSRNFGISELAENIERPYNLLFN